jgi:type II restriction/modification system DNA methylase subunit YeeA
MTNDNSANNPVPNFYRASAADFKKIPGSPIAYWASEQIFQAFSQNVSLGTTNKASTGMRTGDNKRFLRFWHEIARDKLGIGFTKSAAAESRKKWFPYNKGGEFKKWYGNAELVVNWENDGFEIKKLTQQNYPELGDNLSWKITNEEKYFHHGITWGGLTSSVVSFRWSDYGALFDSNKGAMIFPTQENYCIIIGFLNSSVARNFLEVLNPTLSTQNKDIDNLPLIFPEHHNKERCGKILLIARNDWDSYETSWDFTTLPLLQSEYHQPTIRETYTKLRTYWQEVTLEMQRLEEENNHIFIEAYGLQDELTPEVPLSEITLTCNPHYRYNGNKSEKELEALLLTDTIKEFISYAVGCMFGRYSLDKPGLILANQGERIEDYLQQVPEPSFMPDDDNIIPILDDEYFTDDIVGRFMQGRCRSRRRAVHRLRT